MKPISKKLEYDDEFLDPKVPKESQFLISFETDFPFFLAEHFFPEEVCDGLVDDLRAAGAKGQSNISLEGDSDLDAGVYDPTIRHTEYYALTPLQKKLYEDSFQRIRSELEKFFSVHLVSSEGIQVLGYPPGGKYEIHADNSDPRSNAAGEFTHWDVTAPNRTISTILFLSEGVSKEPGKNQCVGGEVIFDYLFDKDDRPPWFRPRKGLLLAFPSTPYFSHTVLPVAEGYRVTMVEWYKADIKTPTPSPTLGP